MEEVVCSKFPSWVPEVLIWCSQEQKDTEGPVWSASHVWGPEGIISAREVLFEAQCTTLDELQNHNIKMKFTCLLLTWMYCVHVLSFREETSIRRDVRKRLWITFWGEFIYKMTTDKRWGSFYVSINAFVNKWTVCFKKFFSSSLFLTCFCDMKLWMKI